MNEEIMRVSNISKKYKLLSNNTKHDTFASVLFNSFKSGLSKKKNKCKSKEFWALKDINFTVNKGDRIGIIGHNGAGKSTLLKVFSRITVPTEGQIEVKGKISSLLEVGTGFHQELTGRENIYLNGSILGMSRSEIERKFDEIVEFSEIGDFLDTPVKKYSSGMYVRLAFAVASHLDPDILIVDEVLAVGDMKFQQKCLGKMEDVSGEGRTVIYVSHNMNTIQQLCNRVIVMDHGKIIFNGNVDDGIKVYMENTKEMQIFNDLSEIDRPKNSMNAYSKMLSVEILDKEECIFNCNESLKFNIRWNIIKDSPNVCMRMIILYSDSTPACMATTRTINITTKNSVIDTIFESDISCLAPGKYITKLVLYSVNQYGAFEHIDIVENAFSFQITPKHDENNNLEWQHRWWGHTKLPEIKVRLEGN
ncbi:polysaccharide ABC transporter ATP-binding protein [Clostridium grantii]|uniref:Lipopolysaccharide transport system ATP-binding protein n=1 Tax=Clostridium grantii DSM 8605 TaxID=1121316 RepID=A0A1M5UZQ0_9CLOT|nr:polysaccharide ABC transporter ATP-binding protein [Clostridium grantii]SHH68449.1 lipopolysaccharide transport system ATP-binding protein [Clostridium grantii DSM 8605]